MARVIFLGNGIEEEKSDVQLFTVAHFLFLIIFATMNATLKSFVSIIMRYFVYILECADGSLYAGCTNDLKKRVQEHNRAKRGAHYTKIRRPVILMYSESFATLNRARKRETEIKRMTREEKLQLIK